MIIRAMGLGFLLWLAVAAAFRFGGDYFFVADNTRMWAFIAAVALGLAAAFVSLRLLKEARGDEGEAAIAVALPSILLNALVTFEFARALPNLDPALASAFGAWALLFAGSVLFTGLLMTQIAPQDERI
jgi:hypothetical protein